MNVPVLIKLCGTEFVPQTTGWNVFIAGLSLTTARTISGWLYDITNSSTMCFIIAGSSMIFGTILLVIAWIKRKFYPEKKQEIILSTTVSRVI